LTEKRVFNKTLNHIFKNLLFIFQIRSVARDERGLTSKLGRPFGRAGEVVAVATLIKGGVCGGVQHQQQQQQQQQQHQQQQQQCPFKGEQGFECEKDTAIVLAALLALETLLGAVLIAFPRSRVCITAALNLVRAIRAQRSPAVVVDEVIIVVDVAPSASAPEDQDATTVAPPPTMAIRPTPRGPPPQPPKREAPLAPREAPLAPRQAPQPIENWCKTITYNRDPSFKNLAIVIHLIKKFLIVGSPSVTKIIISHAICIDLCSQL
jgi:hypothetical protein